MTYPAPSNITGFATWMQYNNEITFHWLGVIFLMILFVVIFLALIVWGTERAFAGASFACFIASILLRIMGLVGSNILIIFAILAAISGVLLYISGTRS